MSTALHVGGAPTRARLRLLRAAAVVSAVRMPSAFDVIVLAVRTGIGLAMLGLGWYEASGSLTLRAQAPWLTVAIAGTAVAMTAQVAWVLRLRRAVAARIASVSRRFPVLPSSTTVGAGGRLVCVTGSDTRLYHRGDCPLTAGRPVAVASAEEHRAARRTPCEVCEP